MRLALAVVLICISACVPVPSPPISSLDVPPAADIEALAAGQSLAVLAGFEKTDAWSTDCLTGHLQDALPQVKVLDDTAARNAFFPWLERGWSLPMSDPAVAGFLARPHVLAKARELGLRYLLVVHHEDETFGDLAEGGFAGVGFYKNTDRIDVTVIDLEAACCRRGGEASAAGVVGYGHALIYGFVLLSPTETAACARLASALLAEFRPTD
jgi:hypothetical protein